VIAEQVVNLVRSGHVEIGISFDPGESEDLFFRPLFKDRFIAVLPPDNPLKKAKSLRWKDLLQFDFIALQRPASMRLMLEQTLARHQLELAVIYETHQLATIGRMVASGLGVSAVPALCCDQMQEMGAFCCDLTTPAVARQVGVVTRRRYPLSLAAQAFNEVLQRIWPSAGG